MTKTCRKCNEDKHKDNFYKKSSSKDGLQNKCKSCVKSYNYSDRNKQVNLEYRKQNRENIRQQYHQNRDIHKEYMKGWSRNSSGVYAIFENGKCLYVGESCMLNQRIAQHKYWIKKPHKSPLKVEMYKTLQQHNNLIFGVIEQCNNHKERETYYINKLKPLYNGRM